MPLYLPSPVRVKFFFMSVDITLVVLFQMCSEVVQSQSNMSRTPGLGLVYHQDVMILISLLRMRYTDLGGVGVVVRDKF